LPKQSALLRKEKRRFYNMLKKKWFCMEKPLKPPPARRADASRNINKVLPIFAENYLVTFSQLTEKYSK
jgi:hypothetical protein